jgi:hypothetical protein
MKHGSQSEPIIHRRVVVAERGFGRFTIEAGIVFLKNFRDRDVIEVPIIGFAWPGFPPRFHVLN